MTPQQVAVSNRHNAAKWIASQVDSSTIVSCDLEMCNEVASAGYPPSQLMALQPTATDPLGSTLVIATPAIASQFGARLASVYAPLVIASFGSGAEQIDVRYIPPGGSAAFEAQLAKDRQQRVEAGKQLLTNSSIQFSVTATAQLRAGQVDPRLLVTLSALAQKMTLQVVTFDDSSPGASAAVPLRGAEIGATKSASLPAIVAFLKAQLTSFAPAKPVITKDASGKSVVDLWYEAPGPLDLEGS
jgi:hypothetical protein